MKYPLIFTLLSPLLFAHTLTVKVSNIANNNGAILIGLYNKANDFTKIDKVYKKGKLNSIEENSFTYSFTNIPDGTYAISILHDENRNKKLDKNFLGIPKEGYGFSNNVHPSFRSATFEEAKFELKSDSSLSVKIVY